MKTNIDRAFEFRRKVKDQCDWRLPVTITHLLETMLNEAEKRGQSTNIAEQVSNGVLLNASEISGLQFENARLRSLLKEVVAHITDIYKQRPFDEDYDGEVVWANEMDWLRQNIEEELSD